MPDNLGDSLDIISPAIPEDSMYYESKGEDFDAGEYLEFLFNLMVMYNASDIYLTYGENPALRVEQQVRRIVGAAKLTDDLLLKFKNILVKDDDILTFENDKSVDLGYTINNRRYRINVSLQSGHIMIVARLLSEKVPTIDELGLPEVIKKLAHVSGGIIFLSGPTGSGKSTTLAAMIEELNQTKCKHIITIEDPIEYVFKPKLCLFEQKQLGRDVKCFATAMKYAVRQRPDVILFGEIRDAESLKYSMSLAETGHLVLTTIHSKSAEQAINRIVSMVPMDEQSQMMNRLSENMVAIIIQKLVKRKTGHGVLAVHEIMINNVPIANIIRENKLHQINNVIFTNKKIGMQLMDDCLVENVVNGNISVGTALENANNQGEIVRGLERLGVKIK